MLVLTRRIGEEIVISENIRVTVLDVRGKGVRIGIAAPKTVSVVRREVHSRLAELETESSAPHEGQAPKASRTRIMARLIRTAR